MSAKKNPAIWLLFFLTLYAFTLVLRCIEKGFWPLILSILGFVGFLALTMAFIYRNKKNRNKSSIE